MTDNPRLCSVGHYCPEHSAAPVICPSGWFQENQGQSSCDLCPAGYYCDNSYGVVLINDTIKCPEGHYCPPGELSQKSHLILICASVSYYGKGFNNFLKAILRGCLLSFLTVLFKKNANTDYCNVSKLLTASSDL